MTALRGKLSLSGGDVPECLYSLEAKLAALSSSLHEDLLSGEAGLRSKLLCGEPGLCQDLSICSRLLLGGQPKLAALQGCLAPKLADSQPKLADSLAALEPESPGSLLGLYGLTRQVLRIRGGLLLRRQV